MLINSIISIRVEVTDIFCRNKNLSSGGGGGGSLNSLVNEAEEIETRALTLITSPSPMFDDCDDTMDYQMELIMKRLESQAKECLAACKSIVSTGLSKSKQQIPVSSKVVIPEIPIPENKLVFPTFHEARVLLENYTNILYPSLWDSKFKTDALRIKQDITCACSQISAYDPVHCIGRLDCLLKVLNRTTPKSTSTTATTTNNTNSNSEEKESNQSKNNDDHCDNQLINNFAWQCLYASTISQAEKQFAYNIDTALVYASLLSGIFALYPDKLYGFLGRVFLACPALGLFCDSSGLSLLDEMFTSTEILHNWRGITRLFTALTLAHPPPHLKVTRHKLLTPIFLWKVISGIVNHEFIPCATAEILHGIFEVAGVVLLKLYGNQAVRLVHKIRMIINNSSILRQSLPEMQLTTLLEKYKITDSNSPPGKIGFIEKSFWQS
nr:unnamed protein product [Trichobilharzia regenti]